jgi:hypothetical protein
MQLKMKFIFCRSSVFVLSFFFLLLSCSKKQDNNNSRHWMEQMSDEGLVQKITVLSQSDINHRRTLAGSEPERTLAFTEDISAIKKTSTRISLPELQQIADSLILMYGITNNTHLHLFDDSSYINSSLIRRHAERSLKALGSSLWRDSISFEIFTEYILPYKLTYEVADNWRDTLYNYHKWLLYEYPSLNDLDSLYSYHLKHTYNQLGSRIRWKDKYPSEPNFSWLSFVNEGECTERCRYVIYHLRAAGAPATFDYIPAWGNRPYSRHAYVGLAHRKQQLSRLLENANDPSNVIDDLNASMTASMMHVFDAEDVPCGLYIQYEKTIPKVYRQTWSVQPEIIRFMKSVAQDEIHTGLISPYMIDVTSQYLRTADVKLNYNHWFSGKVGYLSVFGVYGWSPVSFSRIGWRGRVHFKDMGKNIVYMPMIMENNRLAPFDNPFHLSDNGSITFFVANHNLPVNMRLLRKYPLFSYIARYLPPYMNAIFQGANDIEFNSSVDLYTIKNYPFFQNEYAIDCTEPIGHIRLKTVDEDNARLGTLEAYVEVEGIKKTLPGKVTRQNAMLHLELEKPEVVSGIRLWPRNDGNYIIPGNQYELFYWDNGWVSSGRQTAKDYHLDYKNIPSGTIYWLRCHTEGKEERIFTYENDMQIWW